MSYLVLARKWRPKNFDELVGQEHVRRALTNALDSGRIHHAFLFTGTRGVGKTTIARIFAKSLNCERGVSSRPCGECSACRDVDAGRFVDLLEVDAASRTKVDDTRELLDNVQYAPTRGRYKVYLIDEVHMLSAHSFNALLKTLEEPPPHIKFLLATTDPQKLPVTVLSRCLQFHLRRLPPQQIIDRLVQIATAEKVEFEPGALKAVARAAEGSLRDALSLLDQVLAFGGGKVLEAEARSLLGTLDRRHVETMLTALAERDGAALMRAVAELDERAPDYGQALGELASALQRMALLQAVPDLPSDDDDRDGLLGTLVAKFSPEELQLCYQIAITSRRDLDFAPDARGGFEMALLRMLAFRPQDAATQPTPAAPPRATQTSAASGARAAGAAAAPTNATAPRSAALSTSAKPAGVTNGAGPVSASTPVATNGAGPAAAAQPAEWNALLAELQLQGPVQQLAAHCVFVTATQDAVRLRLDRAGEYFRRPQLEQKLAQALAAHYGRPIRLDIVLSDAVEATPARQQQVASDERIKAAQLAIDSDPAVRAMRDVFGATVQPGSVKPIE